MSIDALLLPLAVEVAVVLAFLGLVRAYPRAAFVLSSVGALGIAYGLGSFSPSVAIPADSLGPTSSTMLAATFAPGETEHDVAVKVVPVPRSHKPWHVVVRTAGAGLNPSNFKVNLGKFPFIRHAGPHVLGYDVSGTVVSVGDDPACAGFEVGSKVYGFAAGGSAAEFATLLCSMTGPAPASLSMTQTAGLPVAALTSLKAWQRGGLKRGDRALVLGASGGCGIFGVTLAKAMGAHVTAVCSKRNVERVRGYGADVLVDYTDPGEMERLKALGKSGNDDDRRFDVIYDTVSSFDPKDPDYVPDMMPLLKKKKGSRSSNGRYEAINGSPVEWVRGMTEAAVRGLLGHISPAAADWIKLQKPHYDLFLLGPKRKDLETLSRMFDDGSLARHAPVETVALAGGSAAALADSSAKLADSFARLKSRRLVGKLVLTFG